MVRFSQLAKLLPLSHVVQDFSNWTMNCKCSQGLDPCPCENGFGNAMNEMRIHEISHQFQVIIGWGFQEEAGKEFAHMAFMKQLLSSNFNSSTSVAEERVWNGEKLSLNILVNSKRK